MLRLCRGVKQQKCLAHVLRSISEVVQTKRGRGRSFGNRLSRLLREAMELRQAYHRGEAADFAAEAERLRREATYHLRDRPMSDADNWRLQNELGWHDDRGNLLRFLDDPSIEPTNNRAERALRGAVIARKVSHCSKNVGGADAFSAFTSVIRTLARNGGDHSLSTGSAVCSAVLRSPPLPSEPLLALRSANQLRLRNRHSPIPRPQVTGYRVQICRCRSCGKQVRGRHPDVAPDQYGASAHRVGRRVMAAAHVLHYGVGVPVRKVPAVLRALTGVELSQGAISQDALRTCQGCSGGCLP